MKFSAFEPLVLKETVNLLKVSDLSISDIIPAANQPRKSFNNTALLELSESIKKYGVVQPIIVEKISDSKYQLIAGERRWRASKLIGNKVIPAIIKEFNSKENFAISLIENIQRESLNPIELAYSFKKLSDQFELSHEAIGSTIGKSREYISNTIRLLRLHEGVRNALIDAKIEMGHARALLALPIDDQLILCQKIILNNLSVRKVEELIKVNQVKKISEKKNHCAYSYEIKKWSEKLSKIFSLNAKIKINKMGEGSIVFHFSSPVEIEYIIKHFEKK